MLRRSLNNFVGGWFIGAFEPSVLQTDGFEVAVKRYSAGDQEPVHYQRTATEVTVVVSGRCRLGSETLGPDDLIVLPPLESADFEALEDVVLVAVKFPSIADDKVLGEPHAHR